MTLGQIISKLEGVPVGALILMKDTDGLFNLHIFKDLNKVTGHVGFGWGAEERNNYTCLESHLHCSRIQSIKVLRR